LISSYGIDPSRISLSIKADEVQLPINAAIPCGLVVNELISNAMKHAFPDGRAGEIAVTLRHSGRRDSAGDWINLSVSDDGIGIPAELDIAKTDTLGLQLVLLLTSQLHGKIDIRRGNPSRFALEFPVLTR
jgi:two-component sensor histidine kinase